MPVADYKDPVTVRDPLQEVPLMACVHRTECDVIVTCPDNLKIVTVNSYEVYGFNHETTFPSIIVYTFSVYMLSP